MLETTVKKGDFVVWVRRHSTTHINGWTEAHDEHELVKVHSASRKGETRTVATRSGAIEKVTDLRKIKTFNNSTAQKAAANLFERLSWNECSWRSEEALKALLHSEIAQVKLLESKRA